MKKALFLVFLSISFFSLAQNQQDSLKQFNLQEVQIVSVRAGEKTPLAYSNLSKDVITKHNFGQDIPFILTLTPSVVATSDAGTGIGYTGFRIRGTDANRINITTNGIPMNDSESQGVFWVNVPDLASSIEDLQVQRGVGSSTNGAGAFGASINMKTENIQANPYGELNGSYGSFNTSKVTLKLGTGQINQHWFFDARLSGINSDGYIDRAATDLKSYFFQTGYRNEKTLLKFIVFGGVEKTYHAWDGVPKDKLVTDRTYNPSGYMGDDANGKPLFYENQTDNYRQTNYQISWMQVLNPNLNFNAALHYTQGAGYYEEYKREQSLKKYDLLPFVYDGQVIGESDLVRQKHLDNDFYGMIYSLNYKKDRWDAVLGGSANYYDGNHFGKVIWTKNYAGDPDYFPGHEYYRSWADKTDATIYLKTNYQLASQWNVYADVQYRFIDYQIEGQNDVWDSDNNRMQLLDVHKKFDFFNPKAGVSYHLNDQHYFYASLAVAHREPNRNNYTDAGLNEMPKAERLYDYELGYQFNKRHFSAGANFYYMKYKDQLILSGKVNEIGEMLTSNIPDSYRMGVELMASAQIVPWLKWSGNLTLSQNRIRNFTEYVDMFDEEYNSIGQKENYLGTTPISFSPEQIANSLFSFSHKKWSAGFQSIFVGKQQIDNTGNSERQLDSYFVNNLQLGYLFKVKGIRSLVVNILINNIFNEQYESNAWVYSYYYKNDRLADFGYFPQAGTNVLFNVGLKF